METKKEGRKEGRKESYRWNLERKDKGMKE